jgi:transposase
MSKKSAKKINPTPAKRYVYGAINDLMTDEDRQVIRKYIFASHRLDNAQTEITRWGREQYTKLRSETYPRVDELEQLVEERKEAKRAKTKYSKEEKTQHRLDNTELKQLKEQIKNDSDFQEKSRWISTEVFKRRKVLTAQKTLADEHPDVNWSTAGIVKTSAEQRAKKKGAPPKFNRFEGEGRIGGQHVAGPAPQWRSLLGKLKGNMNISDVIPNGKHDARRVSFRLVSGEWISVPVVWHRDLPEDARVCAVELHAVRRAGRTHYNVQFVIRSETFVRKAPNDNFIVGLDIGWRRMGVSEKWDIPNRVRVAALSNGEIWEIDPSAIYRADQVQGDRDKALLTAMHIVHAARLELPACDALSHMADPTKDRGKQIGRWSSSRGMVKLIRQLESLECTHNIMEKLYVWKKHDHHLWQYADGARTRGRLNRKDAYRKFLFSLSMCIRYLAIEHFPTDNVKRKPGQNRAPNRQRLAVAPYQLQSLCAEYFPGDRLVRVNAAYTSRICPACHRENPKSSSLKLTCQYEDCGHEWDRDPGAALEIERLGALEIPGSARISQIQRETPETLPVAAE